MSLFVRQDFMSHSGVPLTWKIECQALTPEDWACLARVYADLPFPPFRRAIGIPQGGLAFAAALHRYAHPDAEGILFADDVLTTGASFAEVFDRLTPAVRARTRGVVAFDRSGCSLPPDVFAIFSLNVLRPAG